MGFFDHKPLSGNVHVYWEAGPPPAGGPRQTPIRGDEKAENIEVVTHAVDLSFQWWATLKSGTISECKLAVVEVTGLIRRTVFLVYVD